MSSWKVLASFTIPSSDNSNMNKIINAVVKKMATTGVPFFPILENEVGNNLSRPMAKGYREADNKPALPVDAKAASAAIDINSIPALGGSQLNNFDAATAAGAISLLSAAGSIKTTIINTPIPYISPVTISDSIIV